MNIKVATGEYINVYGVFEDGYKDMTIVLNEPNDKLTINQVDKTEKIIKDIEKQKTFNINTLHEKLEEVFPYGVQIILR